MKIIKTAARPVLFLILFVIVISFSVPCNAESMWEKRRQALDSANEIKKTEEPEMAVEAEEEEYTPEDYVSEEAADNSISPEDITIPEQYGTIIETHKGTNGKLIIHIQDAHCNYEGQINEAKIIESLIEDYGLNVILGEGHINSDDYKNLRSMASLETRKEVADSLVRDAYFTGINYLDLATDYPTKIRGLEERSLYDSHVASLWEIDKFKDLAREYVNKMIVVSESIKPRIYSEDLLELDNKKKAYDNEETELLEYYGYLYKKAEGMEMPLYTFPNFQNLIKASDLEKKIDLVKVRDGSATDEEMNLYGEYLEATRDLNINELFKEEPLLEDVVQDILAVNSDQRKLLRTAKALTIVKNLLKIKVVPEEYKYFTDNKNDFDPQFWTDFLAEKSRELNIATDMPGNYYIISDNLPKIEEFYSIAAERDNLFITKTEEYMGNENARLGVLVAGGFHTPVLTKLLSGKGYSYVVISPKVTTETDDALYRWALKLK